MLLDGNQVLEVHFDLTGKHDEYEQVVVSYIMKYTSLSFIVGRTIHVEFIMETNPQTVIQTADRIANLIAFS